MRTRCTVPNVLTLSRIAMALAAALLAVTGAPVGAVVILIAAALLDAFDGWYARAFSQCSALGAHLDPFADKILMGVVFGWVGIEARSPVVWALIALVALRETAVTVLRAYALRRRGRFIPASRSGRLKMLTQSIVGLTLLSVTHFLGRDVPTAAVTVAMAAILGVSYASGVGYIRHWRRDEARARSGSAGGHDEAGEPARVSAAR